MTLSASYSANLRYSVSTAGDARPSLKFKPSKTSIVHTQRKLEVAAKMALPQGPVWGTIYGLNIDRIGIVDGSSQNIVISSARRRT